MTKLQNLLAKKISNGVIRRSVTSPSEYACLYRVMGSPFPGPWTFERHPWAKAIHDSGSSHIVGQKAAQMAFTECAINRTFYFIDIKRESVLYVLPTERPDATDFSASRFDPALEMSPHLKNLFSDTKKLGLKRAGSACLFIRSAKSRSQLKSIPAGNLVFDEMDEMEEAAVILGRERASGQMHKTEFDLSTPTVPRFGINGLFEKSTQNHYVFKCPHCNKWTELTYPECIVITAETYYDDKITGSHYICKECKHRLDQETKPLWLATAKWQPMFAGRVMDGFHVNQMYSFTIRPHEFAISAMRAAISDEDEQEFYNSKLGLPHIVKGAKVTDDDLNACIGNYAKANAVHDDRLVCMGVDIGNKIHIEITDYRVNRARASKTDDPNLMTDARVLNEFTVDEFEEMDELISRYAVTCCVVDRQPEQRKAKEFANRFPGIVYTCTTTGEKFSGRDIKQDPDDGEPRVVIDKTSWLDVALRGRFRSKSIALPMDVSLEYKQHIKEPVRIYKKSDDGRVAGTYKSADADHFAMARCYCEIALKLAMGVSTNEDIHG